MFIFTVTCCARARKHERERERERLDGNRVAYRRFLAHGNLRLWRLKRCLRTKLDSSGRGIESWKSSGFAGQESV